MILGRARLERASLFTRARAHARERSRLVRGSAVRRGAASRFARLLACALLAALAGPPAHAAPPPGTALDNTATATALDSAGVTLSLVSNTVRVVVQPSESVRLFPDRGGVAMPGMSVTLAHRLVNTGNLATDFRLDAVNLALDGFDAASLALLHDRDRDGVPGAGDTPVANGGVLSLAAGDSADVLLTLGAPGSAPLGASALVRLTATGLLQGASASVTDTLRTPAVGSLPALAFFDAPDYQRLTQVAALTAPPHVQARALMCDQDPSSIETVQLTLRSRLTGDVETLAAEETAPASGIFRVPSGVVTVPGPGTSAAGDGVLSVLRSDLVTAELQGC